MNKFYHLIKLFKFDIVVWRKIVLVHQTHATVTCNKNGNSLFKNGLLRDPTESSYENKLSVR